LVVYKLIEREEATREDFTDEVQERLRGSLLILKQRQVLSEYVANLVERAEAEGRVHIEEFELSVKVEGAGQVVATPGSLDCGEQGGACAENFRFHEMVELRAEPEVGARFVNWSGACTGSRDTCV